MRNMRFYAIRKHIAYDFLLLVSFLYEVVMIGCQNERRIMNNYELLITNYLFTVANPRYSISNYGNLVIRN